MALDVNDHSLDDSRFDILKAAAQCFMERGYSAASIDEVARSLGATKGRIYHHFPSKAELFAAVFRTGMDMNYAAIEPFLVMEGTAVERWCAMARVHVVQMIRTRAFQQAVWMGVDMHLRGATTPEQRSVLSQLLDYRERYGVPFRECLTKARESGDFTFKDLSVANQLMFMTLNSPLFWYKPRAGETAHDIEKLAEQVVIFAYRGLGGKGLA